MSAKKITIRVNVPHIPETDSHHNALYEWNYRRIAAAVAVFLLISAGFGYGIYRLSARPANGIPAGAPISRTPGNTENRTATVADHPPAPITQIEIDPPRAAPVPDVYDNNDKKPRGLSSSVVRAFLTDQVRGLEPGRQLASPITWDSESPFKIYYFTEIVDLQGTPLVYRWVWQGKTVARVTLTVGGRRWRSYSSKWIDDKHPGKWQVLLEDSLGRILAQADFEIQPMPVSP